MTNGEILDILRLDAIDRAERKLREIGTHPSLTKKEKWFRLLEAIRDDAFAELEDLLGGDLPFDAYWDEEEGGVDQPLAGGSPPWWPTTIYWPKRDPKDHSFWQGKFAFAGDEKTSKKRKRKAWTSTPPNTFDQPSPAKIAASPERTEQSARSVFIKPPLGVPVVKKSRQREALTPEQIRRDDEELLNILVLAGVL